ncbi:MAG: hypothetical protein BJ554DRAFT_3455 [Olpidium bornovanus]|uniref:Uncharacterized protein n=1 Tax=Olpidium bornovanus TaxID=278681 RepID=A0A8H8A0Q6_9FUNG|nr:MAG: hypothetical protein BJ554DRAFT_3455 [Olpidium bornovanus]
MLKQRWKPTGPQEPTDPAGRAHDGQHDAAAGEDPGQTAKASERNRRGLRFFAGAKGELPVAVEDHGSETLIKKRWFREGERDRTGSAAVGESAAPAAGKAEGQAAADGAGSRLTADTAGSVWHEQLAPPGQEPVLTSGNFAERAGGIAQQIVKTTLQGCANLPHLVSRARAPLLMSQEYPFCVAWPSALFLVIFLAYYLSRPPRSRRRPSEFVIPSSSVFRNPERYTHLRKVSVPRLSADYVESEVEFRHPEDPANSMRQLDQWAYFPGNGWLAFLGLAPLLYVDSNSSEDHRNATAISFSSRTGGLTAEDAFDVDGLSKRLGALFADSKQVRWKSNLLLHQLTSLPVWGRRSYLFHRTQLPAIFRN